MALQEVESMKALRCYGLLAITLLLTVLLEACGAPGTSGTPSNTAKQGMSSATATTPSNYGGKMYATPTVNGTMNTNNNGTMMGGITITPAMAGNMAAFIHTGKAAINGNQVNVLMTNKGFALYYYMADPMLSAICTGQCAQDWPPVLAPKGMMTVSSSVSLPRQLSVHQTPNGAQVFYDGHALYTYAADKQPGIATGRAQDMQWYLVGFLL